MEEDNLDIGFFNLDQYEAKNFLFARWIATCYSTDVLNNEDGNWWKQQLIHFNNRVYPEYQKNGTVKNTIEFLKNEQK